MIGFPENTIAVFLLLAGAALWIDLYMHEKIQQVSLKSATFWSLFYVAIAMVFAGYLYQAHGSEAASLFLTGYTLEKALAFDNLFVFSMIFVYFKIPDNKQHDALHWGILGAVVFRLIFVFLGVTFMELIGPAVEVVFAVMIMGSIALMIKVGGDEEPDYINAWYIRASHRVGIPMTPLIMAVITIEISDIMFSFDSVPAVIAVTKDPLLIYSSMIFAILGLRSMYFVIAALTRMLEYMDEAVMVVLSFIALKLLASGLGGYHIDPNTSLLIVLGILSTGVTASLIKGKPHEQPN